MNLAGLTALFAEAGCRVLYAKTLAENDNSKNQVYFAGAVEALNIFPSTKIFAENTKKGPSFKAALDFGWLLQNGRVCPAPHAQLILYSQYPEVRFSGFLKGCSDAPSDLMVSRSQTGERSVALQRKLQNRVLFLGVTTQRKVVGYVAAGDSQIAAEFRSRRLPATVTVFSEVPLPRVPTPSAARVALVRALGQVNRKGWIDSKQLDARGNVTACEAPQCGGFTLEAELGIPKNSASGPDYMGWEVKQFAVANFLRPLSGKPITLMTPEPTGGFYRDKGVEAFIRRFGYKDRMGRADRINFGGIYRAGQQQLLTQLTLNLTGYDAIKRKIVDAKGAITLTTASGVLAAEWKFEGILAHWSRKHMQAAYVPSQMRHEPRRQYRYGSRVSLAQRTDALHLLAALACGDVYYDPGIKLEKASTGGVIKRRSQFRIAARSLSSLYEVVETVDV